MNKLIDMKLQLKRNEDGINSRNERLTQANNQLRSNNQMLKSENQQLKQIQEKANKEIMELKGNKEKLKENNEKLNKEISDLNEKITVLQKNMAVLTSRITDPAAHPVKDRKMELVSQYNSMWDRYLNIDTSDFKKSQKWSQNPLRLIMMNLVKNKNIEKMISIYNFTYYIDDNDYDSIISCEKSPAAVNFIQSLTMLQHLGKFLALFYS